MNLNLLKSFVTVVENHSISKAARLLHLTQPAVTKHIQALEEVYCIRLIDRNQEAILTQEGEVLYKYAKNILELMDKANFEIQALADSMQGYLQAGASTIPGQYLMPKILGLFRQKYPNVNISLEISDTGQVVNKILDEEIHIGAIGATANDTRLHIEEFYTDELVFIAHPSFTHANKTLTLEELKKYPFIWREKGSGTRKVTEELLKSAGINPNDLNILLELNGTEAIITSVEAGLGISLISHCAARRSLDNGTIIKLDVENFNAKRPLYLVSLKKNLHRKLINTFFETVREVKDKI